MTNPPEPPPNEQDGYLLINVRNGSTAPHRYNFKDIKSWSLTQTSIAINYPDHRIAYPLNNVSQYKVVYNSEGHQAPTSEDHLICPRCGAELDG